MIGSTSLRRIAFFTLAFSAAPPVPAADATLSVRAWLAGEAAGALEALEQMPPGRERDFNQGVVQLYKGNGEDAVGLFASLRTRYPKWIPAVRWLARAEADLGRAQAIDTASMLVKMPGAQGRDHFWAARLFAAHHDLEKARESLRRSLAAEEDLYEAWIALGDVEQALGHVGDARVARERASALYPAGLSSAPGPPPPLPTGRALRYQAKYFVVPLGSVTLTESGLKGAHDRPARVLTLEAKSRLANMFTHINSRFESTTNSDGALVSHRNTSDDSTTGSRQSTVELDSVTGAFMIRETADGLFSYDAVRFPQGTRPHDGLSMIGVARAAARSGGSFSVLRMVNSSWKGTTIRTVKPERIGWRGQKVDAVRVEIALTSPSAAGVVGVLQLWISADSSAIPYRARMGMAFGSITLELMREEGSDRR